MKPAVLTRWFDFPRAWIRRAIPALLVLAIVDVATAAPTGRVQGRVVASDTGQPVANAEVVLLPADSTMNKVGGYANADGTFLLEAAPGRYTLQIRALSYTTKRITDVVVEAGRLASYATTLAPAAILQQEVVVEARAKTDGDISALQARRKAAAVGDAVSAEQVRKSPDKDAGEVLRRVTGLTVSDGKYVYVRGLGERYSSTEIDGVRIASPEQNRRVVPLDLVPAALLDHVVVQKTYTADRPGEFGGGDVQVHMKDFPGARTWSFSAGEGYGNATFRNRATYDGSPADVWGFGAADRGIPSEVRDMGSGLPLVAGSPPYGLPKSTLAAVARSFRDVWSPGSQHTAPNGNYALSYGDEYRLFGRSLGVIASGSFARTFDQRDESQRLFAAGGDTSYDYAVHRAGASAQLSALAGLGYRLTPNHSVHVRGLFVNDADDEVRTYQGVDHNRVEATTGTWIQHRDTRLMYLQRAVMSGTVEGEDAFPALHGMGLDWKLTRSEARRQQPDRREVSYDRGYYYGPDNQLVGYWGLGSTGTREYGDLHDDGWGTAASASLPYALQALGHGRLVLGYDRETTERRNFYRRFDFFPNQNADPTMSPESLFSETAFDGGSGTGYVEEATLPEDNYHARSKVSAGFVSADVPGGRRLRATLGVRVERGEQDVRSFDLFHPAQVVAQGGFANTDWLPSANATWTMREGLQLRLAASRTLSRPDLNELSPSPSLDYVAGYRQAGNPHLHRARIANYDARVEWFPSLSEVLAAGVFYKRLDEPIEESIQGAVPPLLTPVNSDHGRNQGVELEARTELGRWWGRARGLAINTNAAIISSRVVLKPQLTPLSDQQHPLQGQASYALNLGVTYSAPHARGDVSLLFGAVGRRLRTLGYLLPDIYDQPTQTLDAAANLALGRGLRLKLAARNLTDPRIQQLQNGREVSGYRAGRSGSLAVTLGS